MNATPVTQPPVASRHPGMVRTVLLGLPLLVATVLFIIWRMQIAHLQSRTVDVYGTVPAFGLTNQEGKPFGSTQLYGKIWIADFVFTTCPGPCPMISSRMGELQKPLAHTGIHLVSFSVDPDKDTPEVLRGYAEKLKANPQQWDFLTGPKSSIYELSRNGFNLAAEDNGDHNPVHSTRMILVDRHRQIRGYYDALAPDAVTKIVADAKHLLREQPK
jgi:protein SCO1/2